MGGNMKGASFIRGRPAFLRARDAGGFNGGSLI